MLSLNLDKENDILYLGILDTSNSYGEETTNGVVVLHDIDSDTITGITIFDFFKKYNNGTLSRLSLPFKIDFKKDVINNIM